MKYFSKAGHPGVNNPFRTGTGKRYAMNNYRIVVIPGDGIGPEIVELTLDVLNKLQGLTRSFKLTPVLHKAGAGCYLESGRSITSRTLQAIWEADATLKGPVGLPEVRTPAGNEAGLMTDTLIKEFDLYANLRPIRLYPNAPTPFTGKAPGDIDYVIVQENTQGMGLARNHGLATPDAVSDTLLFTRPGCERIIRFAFHLAVDRKGYAPEDGRRRVTLVERADLLTSYHFFRHIFLSVAGEFPDIDAECLHADDACAALVGRPGHFQVIVTDGMFGEILSGLGAATVGGQGLGPSAHIGENAAYFEPLHGSSPTIAGQGLANPLSQILSAALMLDYLGLKYEAHLLEKAVWRAMEDKCFELAPSGEVVGGTGLVARALIDKLEEMI